MGFSELTFPCSRENWETGQNGHDLKDAHCEDGIDFGIKGVFGNEIGQECSLVKGFSFRLIDDTDLQILSTGGLYLYRNLIISVAEI